MSIAEEERRINEVIDGSKARLRVVEERVAMLGQERVSIDEDIQILTQRAEAIRERLKTKKEALKSVTALTA
jgi:ribosomal protein S15P/S13E